MKNQKNFCLATVTHHLSILNKVKFLISKILEAQISCILEMLKTKCYDMRYAILCRPVYMTSLISIVLFPFIFDLLSVFMVITNIKKIELINATESYL